MLNFKSNKEVEILGIKIDKNLNFNIHIKSTCRKAGQKLSAILRISSNLNMKQEKLLYKSMIKSQFNYCPLVWMFCSRHHPPKNYKTIIENVFNQPELFRVINMKCFSKNFRTLSNY